MDRERLVEALGLRTPGRTGPPRTDARTVTVTGPAGIGKTHLLRLAMDEYRSQAAVVLVVGDPLDQRVPLGGVEQLLAHPMFSQEEARFARARRSPADPDDVEPDVVRLVVSALERLAGADGLLVVDGAQWLDGSSRSVVADAEGALGVRMPRTLIAERKGEPLLPQSRRIDLSGLSDDEVARLAGDRSQRAIDVATLDECIVATSGNPLAVVEWCARDPSGERHRPVELGEPVRASDLATRRALCLLARRRRGDDVDAAWSRFTHHVADDGDQPLTDIVRRAAGQVVEPDEPLRFRHPQHRLVAMTCVDVDDIAAIASALAATTSDEDSAAWHVADATIAVDDDVSRLLGDVARRARERGTPIEAAWASERAAELASDPELAAEHLAAARDSWSNANHA